MARTSPTSLATDTVVTARGYGVAGMSVVAGFLGIGFASPALVYIGVAMVSAVGVATLWMTLSLGAFGRRRPIARRDVVPRPLTAHQGGEVTVTIQSGRTRAARRRPVRGAATARLDIREQAAAELTGGVGAKARVSRTPTALTLSYSLMPTRRGRWALGPALVHSLDPFGFVWADTWVGEAELIPVWPAVVDLSAAAGALMGHADRVVIGARTPSPDDASLRDYREGDDLRRVHWPSTARRGAMVVRSDERAGRRPATVIMDLPREPHALEWSITAAASIALSVLDSGHPVRLLGGGLPADATGHVGEQGVDAGRTAVLNQTLDLTAPVSRTAATRDLIAAAHHAAQDALRGEVIVGVFEALDDEALAALVPLGDNGRAWAMVRGASGADRDAAAEETAAALRRAGWRTATVASEGDLEHIWTAMVTAGEMD